MSARELAEKLEVSVRTINRDIEKLSEARIPIFTTRGRDGGLSLLPDFILNKKVLTEEEKSGILSSMRLMGTVAYDDEQEALRRLEDFFGQTSTDWVEINLDNWGEGYFDRDRFKLLKMSILKRKKIEFDYSKQNQITHRKVRPIKLVFRGTAWYLQAFCELRKDFRYFKLHRMRGLIETNEDFESMTPPDDEPYYYASERMDAVIAIDKSMAYRAFDELDATSMEEDGESLIFHIRNAEKSWILGYILSYGGNAQVIAPDELREEICQQAKQILIKNDHKKSLVTII